MFGVQAWGAPGLWQKDSRSGRRKNRLVDSSLTLLEFGRRNGGTPSSGTCPKAGRFNWALAWREQRMASTQQVNAKVTRAVFESEW